MFQDGTALFQGVVSPKFSWKVWSFSTSMMGCFRARLVKYEKHIQDGRVEKQFTKIWDENLPRNLRSKRHWIWRDDMTNLSVFYYSFVLGSSRHLVEISGGFEEFCDVHIRFGEVFNNTSRDSRARGLQMLTMMVFNDFRWCLSKTFHRKSFFHLAEVSCFQIQKEIQIDGTCGKLRDAYQAGYSVLLKSLWFEKKRIQ